MIVCLEIPVPIQIQFKGTRVYVERGISVFSWIALRISDK